MANLTSVDVSGHNMTAAILDFTPDTQGSPQGMTEDDSSIMSSCPSSSEETPSLSLPSVPVSLEAALAHAQSVSSLARCTSVSSMTMKEFDNKLNELRKENFNLKLRLYFMEKERNGITRPECESMVQCELNRKDHLIAQLQEDVTLREGEIKSIKSTHEKSMKKLNSEWKSRMELVTLEKDDAVNTLADVRTQLDTTSSLAKSLMHHLMEIRHFWKSNLPDLNSSKDVILSLNNWFNSSEDVLNSASVLITDDQENQSSFMNRSSHLTIGDHTKHHHNQRHLQTSGVSSLGLLSDISGLLVDEDESGSRVEKVRHQKRPHTREPFERDTREPFKTDTREPFETDTREPVKTDVSLQTDLKFTTINAIFKDYNLLVNREVTDASVQVGTVTVTGQKVTDASVQVDTVTVTGQKKTWTASTQTEVKKLIHKSTHVQWDLVPSTLTTSTSSHDLIQRKSIATQSDAGKKGSKSIQIQVVESSLPKDGRKLSKRTHFDPFFSPCRELDRTTNDGDVTTFKEISTSGHERTRMASNGLFTYKMSGDHKVSSRTKSRIPTSISHQALNCTSYQLTPTSSTGSKSCPNTPSSPPSSSPLHVPLKHVQEEVPSSVVQSINSHSSVTRSQKNQSCQECQECRSLERLAMDINHERLAMDINHHSPSNSSSSSTSSLNQIIRKTNRRTATKLPLLSPLKEVSLTDDQWSNLNNNSHHSRQECQSSHSRQECQSHHSRQECQSHHSRQECQSSGLQIRTNLVQSCECCSRKVPVNSLSSPDLGIGDSDDHQEVGNLRACLPLSKYQRLRGLIHESMCIMNSLEGIQRDFSLSILTRNEFVAASSPCFKSLSILLASAKATFKSFYIQDDNDKLMDMPKETVSIGTMARSDQDTEILKAQLQRLKMKKQKMEKAISRQLQKTDQLLRKAAVINEITD